MGAAAISVHTLRWLRELEDAPDDLGLGERLLAFAISPEGAGASGARLFAWDGACGVLRCARSAGAPAFQVHEARAPGPGGEGLDGSGKEAAGALAVEELDPLARRAWRERDRAWGETALAGSDSPATAMAALAWRGGEGRDWLVVLTYDRAPAPGARAAFDALAEASRLAGRALEWRDTARRRANQRAALAELAHAVAGSPHLIEGLRVGARAALQGCGTFGSALWRGGDGAPLTLEATAGPLAERESLARALQPLAEDVAASGRARLLERAADDPAIPPEAVERFGRLACLPITSQGRVLGALAVFDGGEIPGARPGFDGQDEEFLRATADGLAALLDAARRADALRGHEQQARELRARGRRRERLAAVGELASRLLQEARHPLASVAAFARRAHRELAESDPTRDCLEVVIREADKLERMLTAALEAGALEAPRFRLESLNAVLQEVLPGVGERLVRRRVRLLKRLDPEAPRLLLDADRIRQVLRNALEHAVESVPIGGRVRVESRTVRDHAVVEIAFDARREPGALLDQLFVPFATGAPGGPAGLGLAVADQIVREHGGEIRIRSDADWGAAILLTLPIRGNGDRRAAGSDRRQSRQDRRARVAEP